MNMFVDEVVALLNSAEMSRWIARRTWTWLVVLFMLLVALGTASLGDAVHHSLRDVPGPGPSLGSADMDTSALEKLMQVFGIRPPSRTHHERHLFPPQYMLDLYNSIADRSGITKSSNPYGANIIRSFPDQDLYHHMHFMFNLSGVKSSEKILHAEFHLYKMKLSSRATSTNKQRADDVKSHLLEMRVYQVMDARLMNKEGGNRLLDARRVSSYSVGWEVFHVKTAVADWLKNNSANQGLLVTIRTMTGDPINDPLIRVAKRRHHGKKQPILVLFTDDGRPRPPMTFPTADELAEWNLSHDVYKSEDWQNELTRTTKKTSNGGNSIAPRSRGINGTANMADEIPATSTEGSKGTRSRRSTDNGSDETSEDYYPSSSEMQETSTAVNAADLHRTTDCMPHDLYVDFTKIGWASWIIAPNGYNAYYCKGKCSYPLGQNQRPTNHATVQSIVHELRLHQGTQTPCCVPNKLFALSLLYLEENGNVVLKQYEDMIAGGCGCH